MRKRFQENLGRIWWDESGFAIRFYPLFSSRAQTSVASIAIDPRIAFGRPVMLRVGVTTSVIAERRNAGEKVDDLSKDYSLTPGEIRQAIAFERRLTQPLPAIRSGAAAASRAARGS